MNNNLDINSKKFLIILVVMMLAFVLLIIKAFDIMGKANEDPLRPQVNMSEVGELGGDNQTTDGQQNENNAANINTDVEHHVSFVEEEQQKESQPAETTNNQTITEPLAPINENNNVEENKPTSLTKAQETELMFLDAQKLKDEKQYVKALEEYKSILEKNIDSNTNARCYEEMAGIYSIVKRYGTALSYAQKAYSIAPSSNRELLIARLYYKTGDIDKATKKINNILQRDFSVDN